MSVASRQWATVLAAVLAVAASGCSSSADQAAATSTTVAVSDPADMYPWDPEGGFHNAVLSGTFAVEHPCTYVDAAGADAGSQDLPDGPIRSIVRLPEPLTRYDPASGELWVGDYGPMRDGDDVVLVGSEGWRHEWRFSYPAQVDGMHPFGHREFNEMFDEVRAECRAHESFWAASMRPQGADDAGVPLAADLPGLGLHAWDIDLAHVDVMLSDVFLVIDPPCVYVQSTAPSPEDSAESRHFLSLPRPGVRFDPETNSLWYLTYGPFHSGDIVEVGAGDYNNDDLPDSVSKSGCSAAGTLRIASMRHRDN